MWVGGELDKLQPSRVFPSMTTWQKPRLGWGWLPEAIVPFQDVHDGPHWGGQHPVHGEQGAVPSPLVVGGDTAVLDAQALRKGDRERAGYPQ